MIALLPASRPGRGHSETYYTVPWCPFIEQRGGQMPGLVWKSIELIVGVLRRRGVHVHRYRELDVHHYCQAIEVTGKAVETLLMMKTVELMRDLQMFPERPEAPS